MNLKRNTGEEKKPFKNKINTNTSPKVPPTPRINLEDYAMDNFCCTHCAYHSEKTCPEFINTFKVMLLPSKTPRKQNKVVEEDNDEDEEGEVEEIEEGEHLPNLDLIWDETELDNMDDDVMKEACVGIYYNLWRKESPSTSNPTTIAFAPTKTSIEEFLEKDKENENDSTINYTVNDSSNPNKMVMSSNSMIDNYCFKTFFGRSNPDLSSFTNSYKHFELLYCTQIVELDCTLVDISFNNSCIEFTNPKSWNLYFDISRNEYGVNADFLLRKPYKNQTYLAVQLEPGCTDNVAEYEALIQGLRKAINMNVKYIQVFGDSQIVIKQVRNSMHCTSNYMESYQQEVWNLIDKFETFNMKSILIHAMLVFTC